MAGDDELRANLLGELRRFAAAEIAGNATLRGASVDGHKRYIRGPRPQPLRHALVPHRVSAVIYLPRAKLCDVTEKLASSLSIALQFLVGRGDADKSKGRGGGRGSIIDSERHTGIHLKPVGRKLPVCLRDYQADVRVCVDQRTQGLPVQMIRVIVTGGHN